LDSLQKNEGITWGIALKNHNVLIGTIGYWKIVKEHYRAEIGYLLHPEYQGKGLMQEAMSAVIDYGFNTMQLHSLEANVNPGNADSIKLLEKNNFLREAWFRENYFYNGKFIDSFIYSLLTPLQ
jgi:ribosomal-protein-alanine N-acetyltransferase